MHHDPQECWRCDVALEPYLMASADWPLNSFACPRCRAVYACACESCQVLIALGYG